ncbi:hypothetical protein QRD43_08700 [Pelomonas sp. APW6]|uniref:Uncharacterized protein n=1 Tax=Roseateles subflavus TaxID=3053353 RepID=A0ABT7LGJ3_9BURK|nr:hypothetical protein [Pelomonas sp. APW6]MDL5031988.1 hypothetical protein [Pelomonas sp. APW6]
MNRLHAQWQRLFLPSIQPTTPLDVSGGTPALQDAAGRTRALMIELARPADWPALATVWQGMQQDLGLPAPAIAVSGVDGFQLWLSLAEPVDAASGLDVLDALRRRYLPDVMPQRLHLQAGDRARTGTQREAAARPLPPQAQAVPDQWSAFVSQDLTLVFADTPWLDIPPGVDAQADVLAGIACISTDALQRAMAQLAPPSEGHADAAPASVPSGSVTSEIDHSATPGTEAAQRARAFLLQVMDDSTVALPLRIEAAKALLASGG